MASQTPPSGTFAGRYTIERELGRGGTATVYLARDETTSTSVALKVLRRELVESVAADRFLREFRMNAALRHPHIAPILDSGQFGADLFLVMPQMESGSLRTLLDKERQLSVDVVVEIVRGIGSALQHAHERGLIHRDVKPENILFSGEQAYLSDFGIARAVERVTGDSTTSSGIIRGTPAYMSPEQASGDHQFDGRSDQFSFACVVYEMLAGLPAFHGPTQESTIALRFKHAPREISVYRPGISQAIERVIQKGMSLSPADRYANMGEFVKAFDAAVLEPPTTGASSFARRPRPRSLIAIAAAVVALATLSIFGVARWLTHVNLPTDSTQVVVLPLETGAGTTGPQAYEFFHTALRRWQDLRVVPLDRTMDALSRRKPGRLSPDEMRSIAISLGAPRFVVVRPVRTLTGNGLFAEYHDIDAGSLKEAELELPADSSKAAAAYAALGDSMVLRGASDGGIPGGTGPRHLFATQAFIRAISARQEWNLTRADSELTLALSLDREFSRAYLWQAQQRLWEGLDIQRWIVPAERSLADTAPLTPVERLMARGLVSLGRTRYQEACGAYKALIHEESMNFAGWYGLGECNFRDHAVVRGSSPSGWRFRGSLEQAVTSYARAFQLIPATYRGFQQSGYKRLRELLFIGGNHLTPGTPPGEPSQSFLAVPSVSGDSLVFVAWPRKDVLSQRVSVSSPEVVLRLRAVFDTVASRWANAFPRSAEAKEALAISLEIRGEPAALDTMKAAERLATDRAERTQLTANRLSLQLKFASDSADLERVLAAADSLLEMNKVPATPEIAGVLAPIAAMIGRCAQTAELLPQSGDRSRVEGFPRDILSKVEEIAATVSVGCRPPNFWQRLDEIDNSVARLRETETAKQMEYAELNAIVRAILPSDSAWVVRLAAKGGGRTIAAERDLVEGRPESARARLREAARAHMAALAGQVTADAVVPEANLWLALGDTTAAIASLEMALKTVRHATPLLTDESRYNTARMGFLIQAYALHAQLLAGRDRARARQSARVAATMWRRADPELQPTVARLRAIMK